MVWTSTKTTLATAACYDTKGVRSRNGNLCTLSETRIFDRRSGLNRPFAADWHARHILQLGDCAPRITVKDFRAEQG